MMPDTPHRKKIRITGYDYTGAGAYFITICTESRKNLFWEPVGADSIRLTEPPLSATGKIVEEGILHIPEHYGMFSVDIYSIMPNHVHLLLRIEEEERGRMVSAPTVSTVVGMMKRWVSRQLGYSPWQKSFYDHIIRNQQDYNETWIYIQNNPIKHLLMHHKMEE